MTKNEFIAKRGPNLMDMRAVRDWLADFDAVLDEARKEAIRDYAAFSAGTCLMLLEHAGHSDCPLCTGMRNGLRAPVEKGEP